MNTTTNTAVENKNIFSSLLNLYWKPENAFTVAISSVLFVILTGVICYGWQQPFDQKVMSIAFGFIVTLAIVGITVFIGTFIGTGGGACALTLIIAFIGTTTIANSDIRGFLGVIMGTVILAGTRNLWKNKRKYYLPFLLIITVFFTWYGFSNQLTETKVGEIDFEMYSKVDGKLAKKSVFVPLFFSTLEDEYFAVVKLAPRKIIAKVTIPDNPKAKWRGERKFEDIIYVDLQPLNYEARKKIMGSGLWQIETKTTSEVDMPEAIKVEIMKELNLESSDVKIKISEI